jgi:transcriptional regulator with XRE-family HTH domain
MSSVNKQGRGSKLKDLRSETGLTRSDFAARYGFKYDRLEKLEQGLRQTLYLDEIGRYLVVCSDLKVDPLLYFPVPHPETENA